MTKSTGSISAHASPYYRLLNILFRTGHIYTMAVLFGGHVYSIDAIKLVPWLHACIITGVLLMILEAYPSWRWCLQVNGIMTLSKLLFLCLIPWFWPYRVALLIIIIVLGSVGSHLPKKIRRRALLGQGPAITDSMQNHR